MEISRKSKPFRQQHYWDRSEYWEGSCRLEDTCCHSANDGVIKLARSTTAQVIVGTLGMIKIGTDKHINKIPRNTSLFEKQKIALRGTTHLFRRVLSMGLKNITQKRQQKTYIHRIHIITTFPPPRWKQKIKMNIK